MRATPAGEPLPATLLQRELYKGYEQWCRRAGRDPLPGASQEAYLAERRAGGGSDASLARLRAAITAVHGHPAAAVPPPAPGGVPEPGRSPATALDDALRHLEIRIRDEQALASIPADALVRLADGYRKAVRADVVARWRHETKPLPVPVTTPMAPTAPALAREILALARSLPGLEDVPAPPPDAEVLADLDLLAAVAPPAPPAGPSPVPPAPPAPSLDSVARPATPARSAPRLDGVARMQQEQAPAGGRIPAGIRPASTPPDPDAYAILTPLPAAPPRLPDLPRLRRYLREHGRLLIVGRDDRSPWFQARIGDEDRLQMEILEAGNDLGGLASLLEASPRPAAVVFVTSETFKCIVAPLAAARTAGIPATFASDDPKGAGAALAWLEDRLPDGATAGVPA